MAANINVTEDENSIDINDVNVFTVHVKDLSTPGQIQISEDSSEITEDTVDTITEIRTIDLPADQAVNISVNEVDSDTVTIITTDTNVIEVSDNISIVTAASEAASRQLRGFTGDSLWNEFGNDATYTQGNVGIGTNSPSSKLQVIGNIEATTFTGTFIGVISSSAQIASDISGAFTALSNTVNNNTTNISTNTDNISTNTGNITTSISRLSAIESMTGSLSQSVADNTSAITGNLSLINDQIIASRSFETRISDVESGSTSKTLISGSAQIATEISGAFAATSHSIQSRIFNLEDANVPLPSNLVSGSSQIATEISGAFNLISSSIESRISSVEGGSTSKTLVSGSAQIATEISGAFTSTSHSIQLRLADVEAGSTSKTLISGSSQIAVEISGAFNGMTASFLTESPYTPAMISGSATAMSHSLQLRANTLESKVGQALNATSDVEFATISSSGHITASDIRVESNLQVAGDFDLFGDLGIGGTIFGLSGFGVTIDDMAVTSGSVNFGSGSNPAQTGHKFTGSVSITGSHLTLTDGTITADSFTGIFNGALSSSAQIDTQISGAFTTVSHSLQSRLTTAETELGNTLISGSSQIATEISGAYAETSTSFEGRLTTVETELNNTLISGSVQIATEISGAFKESSASIQSRLTTIETKTIVTSSAQIATAVSGAFTIVSHSLQNRIHTIETELSNTLISGSIQIATEVSGAFTEASHSIQSRLANVEAGSTSKTLISSSAQIAAEISGAFNNINFDPSPANSVVVYDNTAKRFYYTGSYGGANQQTSSITQYALSELGESINLSKLIINDFSDSVTVNTDGGVLQLTFGTPTNPYFTSFVSDYDPDRFDKETVDYTLDINYILLGQAFTKGELSASTNDSALTGVTTFTNGQDVDINSSFPSYHSGSHTFLAKVDTFDAFGSSLQIESTLILELNKSLPTAPVITFPSYNLLKNAYNEAEKELELGEAGSISVNIQEGSDNGWTAAATHLNSSRTFTLTVNPSGDVSTGDIEEYWNSGTDNSSVRYHTGSAEFTFTRIRSLRYKVDANGSTPTEEDLLDLEDWTGTIEAGANTTDAIEALTLEFNPSSQFIFIIYDAVLGPLSEIQNTMFNENNSINAFNNEIIGGYYYYRTKLPKENQFNFKLKFAN